jgi:uridine kinase
VLARVRLLLTRSVRPLTIGIAGGITSGKTTVARRLLERLAGHPVAFFDQDSYYRDLSATPLLDVKAFVDSDSDVRVLSRLSRDVKERGRAFDDVVDQYDQGIDSTGLVI